MHPKIRILARSLCISPAWSERPLCEHYETSKSNTCAAEPTQPRFSLLNVLWYLPKMIQKSGFDNIGSIIHLLMSYVRTMVARSKKTTCTTNAPNSPFSNQNIWKNGKFGKKSVLDFYWEQMIIGKRESSRKNKNPAKQLPTHSHVGINS
jgi:hypothetical protein